MKFKDIVVNLVSGAMPNNRVGYYIKRFSQEASVRRLASVLLIGLFIFQSLVFVFPPKASFASGGNDLIPGGIGSGGAMKGNLVNYLNTANYGSAFFQLMGINQDYVQNHMHEGTIVSSQWKYSMGHNAFGGPGCSTRFDQIPELAGNPPFPGSDTVYVGSPSCRWSAGYSPQGLIGDRPVQIGGQWWEIAVIGDCGNIVLRPTPPPQTAVPSCLSVNLSSNSVLVGQAVTMTGIALSGGANDPNNEVGMAYGAYKDSFTTVNDPAQRAPTAEGQPQTSQGVFKNGYGTFVDPAPKSYTFTQPGTYVIGVLVVTGGAFLPGSLSGDCLKIITVTSSKPIIRCTEVGVSSATFEVGQEIPITGSATKSGDLGNADFEYILWSSDQLGNGHEAPDSKGKSRYVQNGVSPSGNNFSSSLGAGNRPVFDQPGKYGVFLRVFQSTDHNNYSDAFSVPSCFVGFEVVPRPVPPKILCQSLTVGLAPTNGQVPNKPTFGGTAIKTGTGPLTPSKYIYKVYKVQGGTDTPMPGSPVTDNNTNLTDSKAQAFTFNDPGSYKVTLTIVDQNNQSTEEGKDSSGGNGCTATFTLSPQPPVCISLTASPNKADVPPKEIEFTGTVNVPNGTVKSFTFDFGDGSPKQKVDTTEQINKIKHTYTAPGKFKASFIFEATTGGTLQAPVQCQVTVTLTDQRFTKQVANLTQLTRDGQPIDANNVAAKAGDVLRYQIGICNASGETIKSYVFKDNISDLLYYTDLIDAGGGTVKTNTGTSILEWPAMDIPALESGKACEDGEGKIIPENFKVYKEFQVKVKSPVPTTGTKQADPDGFDCKVADEFEGNFVSTPINCTPIKIIETNNPLPRTGAGWALAIIGFFAASSVFLFFRNRMLKRELELASTLTEGMYGQ